MSKNVNVQLATGDALSVRRFGVREELSRPFEIEVVAHCNNEAIAFDQAVGFPATFDLTAAGQGIQKRTWQGVCSHMALLRAETAGASTYLMRIVPRLWLTTQRRGNRIYQRLSLLEIVQQLLKEWQIVPRLELMKRYEKHDFVVQYNETDFDFINRLLERAGVTYLFDFDANCELVLTDSPQTAEPRSGGAIPFRPMATHAHGGAHLREVKLAHAVRPGTATFRDWDWRQRTDQKLFADHEDGSEREQFYERYHYHPGVMQRVDSRGARGGARTPIADNKGKVRHDDFAGRHEAVTLLHSQRLGRKMLGFESNCTDLAAGVIFQMDDHPREDLPSSRKYLITRMRLEGTVGHPFVFAGEALFADEPYAPPRRTPRPQIDGVQSAVVVGPTGQEIYTDEFGRVRVQLHWDREGNRDDNSSCWMRVSQDWAGAGYGSVLIPRIGQEVLVSFVGGDPDHPMITGRVYNATHMVPYPLPKHKTRSGWRSDSSPGSGGFNEIMFEDKAGAEMVYEQAQRNLQKLTKREEVERIGNDRMTVVGRNRSTIVAKVDATMVGKLATRQVIAPTDASKLNVLPRAQPEIEPKATAFQMEANRVAFTTGQANLTFEGPYIYFEALGDIVINAGGGDIILEGTRTFVNSVRPPPSTQLIAVEPLEHGTFKSTD